MMRAGFLIGVPADCHHLIGNDMKMQEKIDKAAEYMQKVQISQGRDWISPTEIGNIFGGHSAIGSPICKKAVELGIMERNDKGHYRLIVLY